MTLQITLFSTDHLEDAARLVVSRYQVLRQRLPLLPARYLQPDPVVEWLKGLPPDTAGLAAIKRGRLVGFLTGFVLPSFQGQRTFFSPDWANGSELEDSRRIYEQLYERASAQWVADRCIHHLVSVLAHDRQGLEAWHWLAFGLITVDALRGLEPVAGEQAGVTIRQAGLESAGEVAALGFALQQHLASAPTFWQHASQDYPAWLIQPWHVAWLAYSGSQVVGFLALEPGEEGECQFLADEQTVRISGAFTREASRGQGVATALLNQALSWAREQGFARCAVDFESMNTLATRFWMRWFEPVSYSLLRTILEKNS